MKRSTARAAVGLESLTCERFADVLPFDRPFARARFADSRVRADARPFAGGGSSTPARLAFDRPIAMACFAERAPCLPWRMCSISSLTNSPACVDGALPSRLSSRAFMMVCFSGIASSLAMRRCNQLASSRRRPDDVERAYVPDRVRVTDLHFFGVHDIVSDAFVRHVHDVGLIRAEVWHKEEAVIVRTDLETAEVVLAGAVALHDHHTSSSGGFAVSHHPAADRGPFGQLDRPRLTGHEASLDVWRERPRPHADIEGGTRLRDAQPELAFRIRDRELIDAGDVSISDR